MAQSVLLPLLFALVIGILVGLRGGHRSVACLVAFGVTLAFLNFFVGGELTVSGSDPISPQRMFIQGVQSIPFKMALALPSILGVLAVHFFKPQKDNV